MVVIILGGLAFIGAILCFVILGLKSYAGGSNTRNANYVLKLDESRHHYNTNRQFKLKSQAWQSKIYYICPELWNDVMACKIGISRAHDVLTAYWLRQEGYEFNPYFGEGGFFTAPYGDINKMLAERDGYRIFINQMVDKYSTTFNFDCDWKQEGFI